MLRYTPAARFAPTISPLREQREVFFARDDQPNPDRTPEAGLLHLDAAGNIDTEIAEARRSFGAALDWPMANIDVDEAKDMLLGELQTGTPVVLRQMLFNEQAIDAHDARRIAAALHIEQSDTDTHADLIEKIQEKLDTSSTDEMRRQAIDILAIRPTVIMNLAKTYHKRLEDYDDLIVRTESRLKALEHLGVPQSDVRHLVFEAKRRNGKYEELLEEFVHAHPLDGAQQAKAAMLIRDVLKHSFQLDAYGAQEGEVDRFMRESGSDQERRRAYVERLQRRLDLLGRLYEKRVIQRAALIDERVRSVVAAFCQITDPQDPAKSTWRKFDNLSSEGIGLAMSRMLGTAERTSRKTREWTANDHDIPPELRSKLSPEGKMLWHKRRHLNLLEANLRELETVSEPLQRAWEARHSVRQRAESDQADFPDSEHDAAFQAFFKEEIADQWHFDDWVTHIGPLAAKLLAEQEALSEDQRLPREMLAALRNTTRLYDARDGKMADDRMRIVVDGPDGATGEPVTLYLHPDQRHKITQLVAMLTHGGTGAFTAMEVASAELQDLERQMTNVDATEKASEHRSRLEAVQSTLALQLDHPVVRLTHVQEKIDAFCNAVDGNTKALLSTQPPIGVGPARLLGESESHLRRLEQCSERLAIVLSDNAIVEQDKADYQARGGTSRGYYDPNTERIHLNKTKLDVLEPSQRDAKRTRLVRHERGHAILDILQKTLSSTLFSEAYAQVFLAYREKNGESLAAETILDAASAPQFLEDLVEAGEQWGYPRENYEEDYEQALAATDNPEEARRIAIKPYIDELLNKYADWAEHGRKKPTNATIERLFDAMRSVFDDETERKKLFGPPADRMERLRFDDGDDDATEAPEPTTGTPAPISIERPHAPGETEVHEGTTAPGTRLDQYYDARADLDEVRRNVINMKSFADSHPEYAAGIQEYLTGPVDTLEDKIRNAETIFFERYYIDESGARQPFPNADQSKEYQDWVVELKRSTGLIIGKLREIDTKESDLTDIPPHRISAWKRLFGDVKWLSLLDMKKIYDDTVSNIQDMWKRGTERKVTSVESALTGWISDKVPYLGQLKHYFDRQANQAELDDVAKWEGAYENADTHTIMAKLGTINNSNQKDQLKAIITYLTKNGFMDWDNEALWKALNIMSNYKMPFGPCHRSNILRDKWLRKLVFDIWGDYDLFNNWKTTNDNAFNSKKSEFTLTVDSYANAGVMRGELQKMLQLYVDYTKRGETLPPEVNLHHYEEMVHYAMRVGKMTMEDKFYYLIKGVAVGLLPVERLQVLGGEKLGLLGSFPFLEYFYGKNNTLPEVRALADQLTEYQDGNDTYRPGIKTTLFLRMIVLRDKAVRTRINKAGNRGGNNLDHEDMPYVFTDISLGMVKNLLGNISAAQQKVSPQAMQNAYVGFNEKFKVFAKLAEMEKNNQAQFTQSDVYDLATSIATYVQIDNQLTQWGTEEDRGYLSKSQLENEAPPANSNFMTNDFRKRTRNFLGILVKKLIDQGMLSETVKVKVDNKEHAVSVLNELLASETRDNKDPDRGRRQKIIFNAVTPFHAELEQALMRHPNILKQTLQEFESTEKFLYSNSEKGNEDGGMTADNVAAAYHDLIVAKQEITFGAAGND